MLVIGPDNEKMGEMAIADALHAASSAGLDLVEVAPEARPPVCRIMDYGKFKYQQKKKANLARKKQSVIHIKEVKLRPKTGAHDIKVVVNKVIRFLGDGDKAKVTVMFRGREIAFQEYGLRQLQKVIAEVEDIGVVESPPRKEGRNMWMIIAPKKDTTQQKS